MESARSLTLPLRIGRRAAHPPWLAGPGAEDFAAAWASASARMEKKSGRGPVVVAWRSPARFLAGVLAAVEKKLPVALASPHWGEAERTQAAAQIKPGVWLGEKEARWPKTKAAFPCDAPTWAGTILIPTGGTGGRVRWAIHTWATLAVAARALVLFLDAEGCTHVSTLLPWHVGGLLPAVRALETGGTLWLADWKSLEAGRPPATPPERALISLVPTQLQRLLQRRQVVAWLRSTRAILLGGAAPLPGLLDRARKLRLPIALAYGMTETAAVVAAQTPADFLAGEPPWATPLPHAKIWIGDEAASPRPIGKKGRVWIEAASLFAGYFPMRRTPGPFGAEDCGVLDAQGRLRLLGRLDQVINTGGEKVSAAVVERQIRATGLVEGVRVIGLPDADWGERVAALYTGKKRAAKKLRAALRGRLAAHAIPKVWIHTDAIVSASPKKFLIRDF
jgi:O-succinylbenzoic acid--CoA ligase